MDTSLFGEKVLSLGKRSEQTGTIVETAEMAQALAFEFSTLGACKAFHGHFPRLVHESCFIQPR